MERLHGSDLIVRPYCGTGTKAARKDAVRHIGELNCQLSKRMSAILAFRGVVANAEL